MKQTSDVTPRIDRFARLLCIVLGMLLAIATWIVYAGAGPAFAYGLCGFGAILFLMAGTVGPRGLRLGLVTWLPWV